MLWTASAFPYNAIPAFVCKATLILPEKPQTAAKKNSTQRHSHLKNLLERFVVQNYPRFSLEGKTI